jgi:hypothetical protein
MKHLASGLAALLLLFSSHAPAAAAPKTVIVPLGGNAFVTHASPAHNETITDGGLSRWNSNQAVISTYFYVKKPGQLQLSLVGSLTGANRSQVVVSIGAQSKLVSLTSTSRGPFPVGTFSVTQPGYVKVDLQGRYTDRAYYGNISGLQLQGSAVDGGLVFGNLAAHYGWGRQGPNVHLGFAVPNNTKYFYSEITVPKGQDTMYTYYMANGFNNNYFGIQVNSSTERRVLFSVWDSPNGPTTLVKKGPGVTVLPFGHEGTGGQSYLVFNWTAGSTYRFLSRAQPDGKGNTDYSAWFSERCTGKQYDNCNWRLIATWKYHGVVKNLEGAYCFLESWDSDHGYIGRSAYYGNEWAVTTNGQWSEMKAAYFDVDDTGKNNQRLDFAGGVSGSQFTLRNCGFFSNTTRSDQVFTRPSAGAHPVIDFSKLP